MQTRRFFAVASANTLRCAADAAAPIAKRSKMQTLHKILTGEVQFKNKALVKECNVELAFGAGWKAELNEYAAKLSAEEKKVLERQVARLALTRYTTRELALFAGNGPAGVEAAAKAFMIDQGRKFLAAKGEAEFVQHVQAEAKNANWSDDALKQFIADVKAVKA